MTQSPPQLDYAQKSRDRTRKFLRRVFFALIIIVPIVASKPFVMRYFEHVQAMRLFSNCLHATPPTVAYSIQSVPNSNRLIGLPVMSPPDWLNINLQLSTYIPNGGTLFLGSLTTPNTEQRWLVGVDITSLASDPNAIVTQARVIERDGSFGSLRYGQASHQFVRITDDFQKMVLHGGVVDPANQSHFTIRYKADDKPGIIDGWLKEDGSVILEKRDESPTTTSSPP